MLSIRQMMRNRIVSGRSITTLVDVSVDDNQIATVTLQRPPVNSLNLEFLQEINTTLDDLVKNNARGMILTSASPKVFSAGLDMTELYKPEPRRLEALWRTIQDLWLKLYGSPLITAAAINGHAPAGGCLMAVSCEYRVMVEGKFTIGLNETALGIVPSQRLLDTLRNTVSSRQAEVALTSGRLFTVAEALKIGMIDETASDKADAIAKCQKFISLFERISPKARSLTKQQYREEAMKRFQKNKDADAQRFLDLVTQPSVQQQLGLYLAKLKEKSQK